MSKYDFAVIYRKAYVLWKNYDWFDIICCHVCGVSGDSHIPADIFAALLNHRVYRQGYIGSLRETRDKHGPFLIERLQPSDFVEISFDEWIEYIHAYFAEQAKEYEEPLDKYRVETIDDYLNGLPKDEMRYFKLAVNHDDEAYRHDLWGFHMTFDEYILLNLQQETMWIMVLGLD